MEWNNEYRAYITFSYRDGDEVREVMHDLRNGTPFTPESLREEIRFRLEAFYGDGHPETRVIEVVEYECIPKSLDIPSV